MLNLTTGGRNHGENIFIFMLFNVKFIFSSLFFLQNIFSCKACLSGWFRRNWDQSHLARVYKILAFGAIHLVRTQNFPESNISTHLIRRHT